MHSYSFLPCYSSPLLLLITALLLSSPSYHSFRSLLLAIVLLLSSSPQLSPALLLSIALLVASLPHISYPTHLFSSSSLLIFTALLISYSPQLSSFPRLPCCLPALLPACRVACMSRRSTCPPVSSPRPPGAALYSSTGSRGSRPPPRLCPSPE